MPSKPYKALKPMFPSPSSWRIVRGDQVQVMAGKDKGKRGEVLRVLRDRRFPRVFVAGVNIVTRHVPAQTTDAGVAQRGYAVRFEAPIHYSNVMLVDPVRDKPTRTRFVYEDRPPYLRLRRAVDRGAEGGLGALIPWPLRWRSDPQPSMTPGPRDTAPEDAVEVSYDAAKPFDIPVPTAHRRLRELAALRQEQAARARAEGEELWRERRRQRAARRARQLEEQQQQPEGQGQEPQQGGGGGSGDGRRRRLLFAVQPGAGSSSSSSSGGGGGSGGSVRGYATAAQAGGSGSSLGSLLWLPPLQQQRRPGAAAAAAAAAGGGVAALVAAIRRCGLAAAPLLEREQKGV